MEENKFTFCHQSPITYNLLQLISPRVKGNRLQVKGYREEEE
jgi:hypothetical protein